jgi:predicted nuclease of predicted toxin-antitoxin system
MRLLVDENFPRAAIAALRGIGHDVASVWEIARGSDDIAVLDLARQQQRIIVTFDKDFGELAFRQSLPCESGVVLFRIESRDPEVLTHRVVNVLQSQPSWQGMFASVDEKRIRVRPMPSAGPA